MAFKPKHPSCDDVAEAWRRFAADKSDAPVWKYDESTGVLEELAEPPESLIAAVKDHAEGRETPGFVVVDKGKIQ